MKTILGAFSASILMCSTASANDYDIVSAQLKAVLETNVTASSADIESLKILMDTIYYESPIYLQQKTQMEKVLPVLDINSRLLEFTYVDQSGEYAIAKRQDKNLKKLVGRCFKII